MGRGLGKKQKPIIGNFSNSAIGILLGPAVGGFVGTILFVPTLAVLQNGGLIIDPTSSVTASETFLVLWLVALMGAIMAAGFGTVPNVLLGPILFVAMKRAKLLSPEWFAVAGALMGVAAIFMDPNYYTGKPVLKDLWPLVVFCAIISWLFLWRIRRPDLD